MSKKHLKLKIFGKVQGVGYRFNARRKADLLSLKGFVKNIDDGSVYVEVEGDEENLEKFVKWCKKGPEFARVKRIEKEKDELRNYDNFEIKYSN